MTLDLSRIELNFGPFIKDETMKCIKLKILMSSKNEISSIKLLLYDSVTEMWLLRH